MSCNNVQILNFNHNIVEVGSDNKIIITDNSKCNSVTIPQPVTNILQINSPGPQGPPGPQGQSADSSSFVTTSSFNSLTASFYSFTSSYNTGSFTGSFIGNFEGTASWAHSASQAISSSYSYSSSYALSSSYSLSSSYALSASYALSSSYALSASHAQTASYVNPLHQDVIITGSLLVTQSHISTIDYIDFTVLPALQAPIHNQGRVHWLDDTKTLQIDTDVNNFMIEVGHQNVVRGRNITGYPLTKGRVVYINGESGNRPTFTTASWAGDPTSAATLGFVAETIADNQTGYVVTNGILRGINTNAYAPGTQLYLSSSGQYTSTVPISPLHEVRLGKTITQATDGYIYVDIMNGYELGELHDVLINGVTYGDLLMRDGNNVWINTKSLSGSYSVTGSLTISGSSTFTNIGPAIFSGSVISTQGFTGSFTGSFVGNGSGLTNISASAVVGLNLSQITSGSYSASITNNQLLINTGVNAPSFTGSLFGTASYTLSASQSLSASYAPNIYNQDGSLTGNRILTLGPNSLTYTSSRISGTPFQINAVQTSVNAGDTGDGAMGLSYTLTGDAADTGLVTRVFALNSSHNRTNSTVLNMRVFNLATNTNTNTTIGNLDAIFIENGSTNGTIYNYRGILINNFQGIDRYGLVVNSIPSGGGSRTYILLGESLLPENGQWSIYSANTLNSYHAGNFYIGSPTDSGYKLDVSGSGHFTNGLIITGSVDITGSLTVNTINVGQNTLNFIDNVGAVLNSISVGNNANVILASGSFEATTFSGSFTGSLQGTSSWAENYTESDPIYNAEKGKYLTTGSSNTTQTISGSLVIDQNLTVLGSSSIVYITSSQLNIGTNLITVNTATPAVRFGGLAVYDSGSTGTGLTGSLLWDSQENIWIYSNPSGAAYDGGMLLAGPRNTSGIGNEVGISTWYAAIGNGSHHMTSSQIYNSGSLIRLETDTQVTGSLIVSNGISGSFSGSGANLSNIPASAIVGLNLSQIASGSYSASISNDQLLVNTSVSASSFTGSLLGTATTASYVSGSVFDSNNLALSASYALTASFALNSGAGGSPFFYQATAPSTGSQPITGSMWVNSNTGVEYNLIYDGNSYQWVQQTLPVGPQGPQGVSGTNNIDTLTTTTLVGLLSGDGLNVSATTVSQSLGYVPENVANKSTDSTFAANSDTLYPSQKAVKTYVNTNGNFADEVDYAMIMQQRYFFNI